MGGLSDAVAHGGPWLIMLLIFGEDFGLPLPGETALIAAGVLASQGHLSIALLLTAAWIGAVLGDNVGYAIGRFGGRRLALRYGAKVGLTEARLARTERFFARYGGWLVVIARFVEVLRQLNGIAAGIGRMPAPRFVFYNAIGAALWVGFWGLGAYFAGDHVVAAINDLSPAGGYTLLAVVVIAALGAGAWWWYRRTHNMQPRR